MTPFKKGNTPWNKGLPPEEQPNYGYSMLEETRKKISKSTRGRVPWNKGKEHSEETKRKISEAMKGLTPWNKGKRGYFTYQHTEEVKEQIRQSQRGSRNSNWKGDEASPNAGRSRARRLYDAPAGTEIHHIDGNPLNNAPENIDFLSRYSHMKEDGRLYKMAEIGKKGREARRKKRAEELGILDLLTKRGKMM